MRAIVREALSSVAQFRMPFEDLLSIQQDMDERLVSGKTTRRAYDREWTDVLRHAGWTQPEYEDEIDRRWDSVGDPRPRASRAN